MKQATPRKGSDVDMVKWPPVCNFCGEDIKLHVLSTPDHRGGHKSVWMHKTDPPMVLCAPSLADELLP